MRILAVHNRYQIAGGEDAVFALECELLKNNGHQVRQLLFTNDSINKGILSYLRAGLSAVYNPSSLKVINRELSDFKPDIIHVHNFFPLVSPAVFFAAHKHRIPVVFTMHNFRLICPGALLLRKNKVCIKCINLHLQWPAVVHGCYRGSRIQTISIVLMNFINMSLGTWGKKITRIIVLNEFVYKLIAGSSLGHFTRLFTIKPNFANSNTGNSSTERKNMFLYIGRLSHEKGIELLLDAASKTSAIISIAGDGPLEDLVRERSLICKNLNYLGRINKEECASLLSQSRALLFTSLCFENMPMTILEAFSAGTPVICPDKGSAASLVKNQVNGIHFIYGDPNSLAQAVDNFGNENEVSLRHNALKEYKEKYTPEHNYQMLMNIYEEILFSHNGKLF